MKNEMAEPTIYPVRIISQQPDGYRRASITLKRGINEHRVTEPQLEALKKDTRLTVQVIQASESAATQSHLESGSMGGDVALDLSQAPEELAHIIAALYELKPTKKPNVDELAFEVDGVDGEQKPSAAERDEAWAWYQTHVVNVEQ
ncbi:HI1506-related protein [Pseudoalteromonas sp. S2755]|uniref:HI1506-related protein n=1 Tax=Pseudoalteromonas sp. S2755 TaxID=2066523 RepID=UPI00110AF121|nr:HI1506-related protein [Pseudoalteromonas sp. S2755]